MSKGKRVVTSIRIDPYLWKQFKKRAVDEDLPVYKLLELVIREYLTRVREIEIKEKIRKTKG